MAKIIGWIIFIALVIGLLLPPLAGEAPWPSLQSDGLRAYFRGVVDYWEMVFSSPSSSSPVPEQEGVRREKVGQGRL